MFLNLGILQYFICCNSAIQQYFNAKLKIPSCAEILIFRGQSCIERRHANIQALVVTLPCIVQSTPVFACVPGGTALYLKQDYDGLMRSCTIINQCRLYTEAVQSSMTVCHSPVIRTDQPTPLPLQSPLVAPEAM